MKRIICFVLFTSFFNAPIAQAEYDLQDAINSSINGKVSLPGGTIVINKPVIVATKTIIEGNGSILINTTNDYALKIIGKEGYSTTITEDIIAGGGLPNLYPTVVVEDATFFQVGDYVKIIKNNAFPLRIEFNIIKSIDNNVIMFKKRFIQPFFKTDNIRIVQFVPNENVIIQNLEITSAPFTNSYGLFAQHTKFLSINNVTFKNINRKALYIEQSFMPEILNCQFSENGSLGKGDYGIGSIQNMGVTISGNKLYMSGAIYLKSNVAATVCNNESESAGTTGGDGLSIVSSFFSLFVANIFIVENCYGIWMQHESEHNIISDNQFFSGITTGIYLTDNSKYNLISNNMIDKNSGNGIFINFTADNNVIINNLTTNNKGRGILVHSSNNIIKNNVAKNNLLENIRVIVNAGNVLTDNIKG